MPQNTSWISRTEYEHDRRELFETLKEMRESTSEQFKALSGYGWRSANLIFTLVNTAVILYVAVSHSH